MIPLIRYPGSKAKVADRILRTLPDALRYELLAGSVGVAPMEYREPFFGAGAVGFRMLARMDYRSPVWLNDVDPGIVALWLTVREDPGALLRRCDGFTPTAEAFYRFKEDDGQLDLEPAETAFRKLALHRMSYSGLGVKAGGPIGGRRQNGERYNAGSRWNPAHIRRQVTGAHKALRRFRSLRITCGDFQPLVEGAPANCLMYLDPPYYEKGPDLYKHSMTEPDHARLARLLRNLACRWLLSYDDHPRIRELYAGCSFVDLHITYTTARATWGESRPRGREIIILPVVGNRAGTTLGVSGVFNTSTAASAAHA